MITDSSKSTLLWAGFGLALLWRLVSPWLQYREVVAGKLNEATFYEYSAFAVMGLAFLASGWVAHLYAPTRSGWAFSMYAAFAALHWGGPLATSASGWFVYFLLSGVVAEVLFLHFALVYPEPLAIARHKPVWRCLYGAVAIAALLTVAVLIVGGGLTTVALVVNHTLLPNLFALAAIVVLIVRHARATRAERSSTGLRIAFWAVLVGTLPYLGVSIAEAVGVEPPGGPQVYNFFFLAIPVGLCAAVIRDYRSSAT